MGDVLNKDEIKGRMMKFYADKGMLKMEMISDEEAAGTGVVTALDGGNAVWRHQLHSIANSRVDRWGDSWKNLDSPTQNKICGFVTKWVVNLGIDPFLKDVTFTDIMHDEMGQQIVEDMLTSLWETERVSRTSQLSRIPWNWFIYAKWILLNYATWQSKGLTDEHQGTERHGRLGHPQVD